MLGPPELADLAYWLDYLIVNVAGTDIDELPAPS